MIFMNYQPTQELYENLPQMPIRERDRRWKVVRHWMIEQELDCLLVVGNDMTFGLGMGNFRYLSNCAPRHGGFLIFPREGAPALYAEPWHMTQPIHPCLLAHRWVTECYFNDGIHSVLQQIRKKVVPLRRLGLVSGANTVQYQNMPYDVFQTVQQEMADVEIVDASPFLFRMRGVKSMDEIAFLRKAGEIHHKVLEAKIESAGEGVRESEVYAAMMRTMLAEGGESQGFNLLHSGPIQSPYFQHLLHGLDADMSPSMRVLRSGDTIISETHVSYGGYMSAAEFTVCIGTPPKEYEALYEAGVECLYAALPYLRPGHTFREAMEAERAVLEKYHYGILELGFHGHGIGSPEPPKCIYMANDETMVPPAKRVTEAQLDTVFEKNMVVGMNCDIFDPGFREDVGIMFGDCIRIDDEPELLVHTPQKLPVKQ